MADVGVIYIGPLPNGHEHSREPLSSCWTEGP